MFFSFHSFSSLTPRLPLHVFLYLPTVIAQITQLLVGRLSADLQQRCYRNIGLAVQMLWQFEAAGRRPPDDGPAWNALKNVRKPFIVELSTCDIPATNLLGFTVSFGYWSSRSDLYV